MKQKVSLKTQQETPSELKSQRNKPHHQQHQTPEQRAPATWWNTPPSTATDTRAESPGDLGENSRPFCKQSPKSQPVGRTHRKSNKALKNFLYYSERKKLSTQSSITNKMFLLQKTRDEIKISF